MSRAEALRALAADEPDLAAKDDMLGAAGELDEMRAKLIRVCRLSGEVLKRPGRTLTVYELNRAINGPEDTADAQN